MRIETDRPDLSRFLSAVAVPAACAAIEAFAEDESHYCEGCGMFECTRARCGETGEWHGDGPLATFDAGGL